MPRYGLCGQKASDILNHPDNLLTLHKTWDIWQYTIGDPYICWTDFCKLQSVPFVKFSFYDEHTQPLKRSFEWYSTFDPPYIFFKASLGLACVHPTLVSTPPHQQYYLSFGGPHNSFHGTGFNFQTGIIKANYYNKYYNSESEAEYSSKKTI